MWKKAEATCSQSHLGQGYVVQAQEEAENEAGIIKNALKMLRSAISAAAAATQPPQEILSNQPASTVHRDRLRQRNQQPG